MDEREGEYQSPTCEPSSSVTSPPRPLRHSADTEAPRGPVCELQACVSDALGQVDGTSPLHPSRAAWSGLGHLTSLTHQCHLNSGDGKWKVDSVLEPVPTTALLCVFGKPPAPSFHWSPKLMADWKSSFPPESASPGA